MLDRHIDAVTPPTEPTAPASSGLFRGLPNAIEHLRVPLGPAISSLPVILSAASGRRSPLSSIFDAAALISSRSVA